MIQENKRDIAIKEVAIDRTSVTQQVIDYILLYIKNNSCKAGDKLPTEKEMCEKLGVGRSTVREAYRMLQAMNKVVALQGKGVFVADVKEQEKEKGLNWFRQHGKSMMDFMEIRIALEVMGIRLAIRRADKQEIERLQAIHQCFLEAVRAEDAEAMASWDTSFHNQIALISHNSLMEKMQEVLAEYFSEYRLELYKIPENCQHTIQPHQDIVNAFIEQDEEKGAVVMLRHLQISTQDMQTAMGQ